LYNIIFYGLFDGDGYRGSRDFEVSIGSTSFVETCVLRDLFISVFNREPKLRVYVVNKNPFRICFRPYVRGSRYYALVSEDVLNRISIEYPIEYLSGLFYSDGSVDAKIDRRTSRYRIVFYGIKFHIKPGRHRIEKNDRYYTISKRIVNAISKLGIKPRIVREHGRIVAYAISRKYKIIDNIVLKYGVNYKYSMYKFLSKDLDLPIALFAIYLDYWLLNRIAYMVLLNEKFQIYNRYLSKNYLMFERSIINKVLDQYSVLSKDLADIDNPWIIWDYINVCSAEDLEWLARELLKEVKDQYWIFKEYIIPRFRNNMRRFYLDSLDLYFSNSLSKYKS